MVALPLAAQSVPALVSIPVAAGAAALDFDPGMALRMTVHPSGCIAMFDPDASQVVCITPATGATRRFGRSGSGPGEFVDASVMVPTPDGGLLVFDVVRNLRFTLITSGWQVGRTIPETQYFNGLFRPTRDSVIALGGGARGWDLTTISLKDGGTAKRFSPAAGDSSGIFQGPEPYEYGLWVVPRRAGGWYICGAWHYRILIEDDHGVKRASFGRSVPDELPTARELAAMRATMQKANPGRNLDGLINRWAKDPKPAIATAPVEDAAGRLWVVTSRVRDDSTEVDVFDPQQHFLGTRRVPGIARAIASRGNDLYLIAEHIGGGNDGVDGLLHYRVQ